MKKKLLLTTVAAIALCGQLKAQHLLGIASSNFAGTNGLYTNPSFVSDSRHNVALSLFTMDANVSNDFIRYNGQSPIYKMLKSGSEFTEDMLEENLNGAPKLFTSTIDFRGPSLMVTLSPKHGFGITTRLRGAVHGNNVSEYIARLARTTNTDDILNKLTDDNKFNLNGNLNAELGLTYGRVLYNTEKHLVKGGLTVKRLTGIYSAHFLNNGTRYKLTERTYPDGETYNVLEIAEINGRYGYQTTNDISDDGLEGLDPIQLASIMGKYLTKGGAGGQGWGMDLGFTYEFRPDIDKYKYTVDSTQYLNHRKNKYKYRLGVALMDVGGINYKSDKVYSLALNKQNVELEFRDFESVENTEDVADVLNESFGLQPGDIKHAFRSGLPTALNINLDLKVLGRLYVNTSIIRSLRGKETIGMRYNSLLAVTPRFEFKYLELAVPLSMQNNYSVFSAGAMAKMGPFFIGADNIGGLFNIGKPYGANFYTGISLFSLARTIKKAPKQKKAKTQTTTPTVVPAPATAPTPDSTATPIPTPVPAPVKE